MPAGFATVDVCEGFTSALKGSIAVPEHMFNPATIIFAVPTFLVLPFMGKKFNFDFSELDSMLTIHKSK